MTGATGKQKAGDSVAPGPPHSRISFAHAGIKLIGKVEPGLAWRGGLALCFIAESERGTRPPL